MGLDTLMGRLEPVDPTQTNLGQLVLNPWSTGWTRNRDQTVTGPVLVPLNSRSKLLDMFIKMSFDHIKKLSNV